MLRGEGPELLEDLPVASGRGKKRPSGVGNLQVGTMGNERRGRGLWLAWRSKLSTPKNFFGVGGILIEIEGGQGLRATFAHSETRP